jgi:tetratricopeptide (TPR) repeat protein
MVMRILFAILFHAFGVGATMAAVVTGVVPDSLKQKVDSLRTLADSGDYETRYAAMTEVVLAITDFDNRLALEFATKALNLSSAKNDTVRMIESNRFVGQLNRRIGQARRGVKYLKEAFGLAQLSQNDRELARISNSLGLAYANLGRYDSAMRYYYNALRIYKKAENTEGVAMVRNNAGLLYYNIGDHKEAILNFEESLEASRLVKYVENQATVMTNLALCHSALGNDSLALGFLDASEKMCEPRCTSYHKLARLYCTAEILKRNGRFPESITAFQETYELAAAIEEGKFEVEARLGQAQCLVGLGRITEAIPLMRNCEHLATERKYDQVLLNIYGHFTPVLAATNRTHELVQVQRKFLQAKDRVFNERILTQLAVERVEFEEQQNEQLISKQADILELNKQVIDRQRLLILLSVGLAAVLLVLAFVLVRFFRFQKRISFDLDRRVLHRTKSCKRVKRPWLQTLVSKGF